MIAGVSTLFTYNAFVLLVFILGWSFYAFRKKNYSLIEIGWPLSLVFVVWTSFLLFGAQSLYRRLLVLTVTIWGLRLAFHLYTSFWDKPESRRYARLRADWEGKLSGLKAILVLVVGPLLVYYIISMILSIGFLDSQAVLAWWQYLGIILWFLGMLFEIGSERQLKKFLSKEENQNQMMTKGLWRFSRHPHYFGTALVWWGIYLISIVNWNNLLGILSPITMTLFAIFQATKSVSEREFQEREELQSYKEKTSQFLPFSSQLGRGFKLIFGGLSKATKASAGAVSSAAQKAKESRNKEQEDEMEVAIEDNQLDTEIVESETTVSFVDDIQEESMEEDLLDTMDESVIDNEESSDLFVDQSEILTEKDTSEEIPDLTDIEIPIDETFEETTEVTDEDIDELAKEEISEDDSVFAEKEDLLDSEHNETV